MWKELLARGIRVGKERVRKLMKLHGIKAKDVQQLLPHLATYLGHTCIASTQRYLQMTPELLQEASCRFAAYAQPEAEQETDHA